MKFKKSVSALAALTLSVTAFAGLAVTANAAAGDVTTLASADFSEAIEDNKTGDFAISGSSFEISSDGWLRVGNGSGSVTIDSDNIGATDKVSVSFKVAYGKLSGKSFYYTISDSNGTNVVNWNFRPYDSTIITNVLGNGSDLPALNEFYYGYNTPINNRAASYTFVFDFATNTVTQTTVNMLNNAKSTHTNPLPDGVTDIKTLTIGSNYNNVDRRCNIDDIAITKTEGASDTIGYSLAYKVNGEGEAVYTASGSAPKDTEIKAVSTFKDADGNKYIVDDPQTFTVSDDASNNNWIQSCRLANTYTAKVVANVNGAEKEISSTDVTEGETWSYTFPMYYQDGTTVYEVANNSGNTYYGGSVDNVTENTTAPLDYTKAVYENVVLYDELDGTTSDNDKINASVRASNCSAYDNKAYTSANLEPGTYDIYVRYSNVGRNSTMTLGDKTIITASTDCTKNSWTTTKVSDVTITEAAPLVWNAGGSDTYDPIDTVLVVKKADPIVAPTAKVEKFGEYTSQKGKAALAYTATFTANDYAATSLEWSIIPSDENNSTVTKPVELPTIVGETEYVAGLIVTVNDINSVAGVTAEVK